MEQRKARLAIRQVAKEQGITENEVVEEIEKAIRAAISEAAEGENKTALTELNGIPCAGDYPNAYELVEYLANKLLNNS